MKILEFDLSAKGFIKASPFWISYALIPVAWISAVFGGWFLFLLPLLTWFLFSILDFILGLQNENEDPLKDDKKLGLYQLTTILWAPIQFLTIFGILFFVSSKNHLTGTEQLGLFFGLGINWLADQAWAKAKDPTFPALENDGFFPVFKKIENHHRMWRLVIVRPPHRS